MARVGCKEANDLTHYSYAISTYLNRNYVIKKHYCEYLYTIVVFLVLN